MAYPSPNPNIFVTPSIQKSQMNAWSATTTYYYGDCVLGSDGMAYCAISGYATSYPSMGLLADPVTSSLSLSNQKGLLQNVNSLGSFTNITPNTSVTQAPNWVNLSLLSPTIPPWNSTTNYQPGDLVFYPPDQPTLVWRRNDLGQTGQGLGLSPPYLPQPGIVSLDGVNTAWNLISNPLQLGNFNPVTITNPPSGLNFVQPR